MSLITSIWNFYSANADKVNPIVAAIGGAALVWAAIQQAIVARRRHEAQAKADLERRIAESFAKAIEQLASDKIEMRLGGIYALERISQESLTYYWVIMETLTAFVRERARWSEANSDQQPPIVDGTATDIAAVLTVICRRPENLRAMERAKGLRLNLSGANLNGGRLHIAHLEGADLRGTHFERADLLVAHLEGADLSEANLAHANLNHANLERALLNKAHLEHAILWNANLRYCGVNEAHLEHAHLQHAHLEHASFYKAFFEGAIFEGAHLEGSNLNESHGARIFSTESGDAETRLPPDINRPKDWPPPSVNLDGKMS